MRADTSQAEIAVLFSGGTDSTLTAALVQEKFRRVHLVTYDRFGFHGTKNTASAAKKLGERFGADKFVHAIIGFDKLFKHISYERYLRNSLKYGFFQLSTCGLCKLAMHSRTIKYCLDNGIKYVCDGANQGMSIFPDQMKCVLDELKLMYAHFGIEYSNPVYFMAPPNEKEYIEEANLQAMPQLRTQEVRDPGMTPGRKLYEMGLAPAPDVKGTRYDRKRQPRCFQLILFNFFAIKHFRAHEKVEDYQKRTLEFFKDKIASATRLLEENLGRGKRAKLFE